MGEIMLSKLWNSLLEKLLKKTLERILTVENLKIWASEVDKNVDIPVLNDIQEKELFESILVQVGLSLRKWIIGE
jgi:hypothetical protein